MDYVMGQMTLDGLCDSREYDVRRISYQEAVPYLLTIHYARRIPTIVYAYGLYDRQDCIGVVTYGIPASPKLSEGVAGKEHKLEVLELNRLVIVPGHEGKNLASMLVGRSLKMIPGNHYIVSYADAGAWGHIGYVYQATNWMYTGMTKRRTDIAGGGGRTLTVGIMLKDRWIVLCGAKSTDMCTSLPSPKSRGRRCTKI